MKHADKRIAKHALKWTPNGQRGRRRQRIHGKTDLKKKNVSNGLQVQLEEDREQPKVELDVVEWSVARALQRVTELKEKKKK